VTLKAVLEEKLILPDWLEYEKTASRMALK
jgi:hypothetical protein